jgi:hypothetical protein
MSATINRPHDHESVAGPNRGLPNSKSASYAAQITAEAIALCLVLMPSFYRRSVSHFDRENVTPSSVMPPMPTAPECTYQLSRLYVSRYRRQRSTPSCGLRVIR